MDDLRTLVDRTLSGDRAAVRVLIRRVAPIVQVRVARALWKRGNTGGRDPHQEVEDMVQEVFVALFESDGRVLRAWDPSRGLSFENFVGLVAERETACILRSGKRSPWTEDPWDHDQLEPFRAPTPDPDEQLYSREMLAALVDELRVRLSPLGMAMFRAAFVQDLPVEELCVQFEMQPSAVYAWKSRIGKLVRQLASDPKRNPGLSDSGPSASYSV